MVFFSSLLYFILAFGILVLIHEYGHFLAARLSGMRVDVFAIGMGPRMFGWNKKSGFTLGNIDESVDLEGLTDYRICAFPLGGYVKIAGMIDESFDDNFVATEPQPWEFRSKGTLAKAFTISAGVIMNFILALIIFSGISLSQGKVSYNTTTVGGVEPQSVAQQIGLQAGDKIISIDGEEVHDWLSVQIGLSVKKMGENKSLVVQRNGSSVQLSASGKEIMQSLSNKQTLGITPFPSSVIVREVIALKPAEKGGIKKTDTLLSVNGTAIFSTNQFRSIIQNYKNRPVTILVKRNAQEIPLTVTPNSDGLIGVQNEDAFTGEIIQSQYSFSGAIAQGWNETIGTVEMFIGSIVQMVKGTVSVKQSVGGPIQIAKMASQQADLGILPFLRFVGLLSITLAVMNILPIPALDGGHLVFIILEGILRREVSPKVKMYIQQTGVIVLGLFMLFVFYLDLTK